MPISIRNPEAEQLARKMAREQGVSITQVVVEALRDKDRRDPVEKPKGTLVIEMVRIAERCSRLPNLDNRTMDEILGYDDQGLFDGYSIPGKD